MSSVIDGEDIEELKKVLLYRKIVEVHITDDYRGRMTLDDGTQLDIHVNEDESEHCDSGYWHLDELNTCDNVITNVELVYDKKDGDEVIQIFVYAEDTRIKAIDVYGNDGNGYYGRGFKISIEKP